MFYENFNLRLKKIPENKACPEHNYKSARYVHDDEDDDDSSE